MQTIKSNLADWTINFLKNKDILLKKISSIDKDSKESDLIVSYKDSKKHHFFILENLNDINQLLDKFEYDFYFSIITINSKENLDILLENWEKLSPFENLTIYFVNPFSLLENKWVVQPHTHDKVSEPESIKSGLKTLFSSVDNITEQDFKKKITG